MSDKIDRISCTIPHSLVLAADRLAARERRSRSWVISEALRRYVGEAASSKVVREAAPVAYQPGLGPSRTEQLRRDLGLTPEERVVAAEATAALATTLLPPVRGRLLQFDRFEDYLAWKRTEGIRL